MKLHPDVVVTETEDGTVLLHLATGRYWQLNKSGRDILDRLLAGEAPDDVVDRVADRFGIMPEQARTDVHLIVDGVLEARLVVES